MPPVLGFKGFGCRQATRDRLVVTAGAPAYTTANVPPDSSSVTAIGGSGIAFRAPWSSGDTLIEPSTDALWWHARYYTEVNVAGNTDLRLGVGRNGTAWMSVSAQASTNLLVLRVAGTVRATATVAAFTLSEWARVHVHAEGALAGDVVRVYLDGDLDTAVLTYTLIAGDATALALVGAPNGFIIASKAHAAEAFDDLVAWDPADADFPGIARFVLVDVTEQVAVSDGPVSDWSGTFADIDERPNSDADKITAIAVGDRSTFEHAAIASPNVFAVQLYARVTRSGALAGVNIDLLLEDGTDELAVTAAAPLDGDVSALFPAAPDGDEWTPTKYDDARFGFETVT